MTGLERRRMITGGGKTLPTTHQQGIADDEQQVDGGGEYHDGGNWVNNNGNNNPPASPRGRSRHHNTTTTTPRRGGRDNNRPHDVERSSSGGSTTGLHHRRHHHHQTTTTMRSASRDADEYEKGLVGTSSGSRGGGGYSNNSRPYFPQGKGGNNKRGRNKSYRYPCGQWIRTCLLAGIPAYLLLIFLFLKRMNHQHALHRRQEEAGAYNPNFQRQHDYYADIEEVSFIRDLHAQVVETVMQSSQQRRQQQQGLRQVEELGRADQQATNYYYDMEAGERALAAAAARRERTRPPSILDTSTLQAATISSLWQQHDDERRPETRYQSDEEPRASLMKESALEEICGFQAQNAALETPGSFLYRDALKMPKSRITRVLITGILSQPAYILALALKERCNVQVIIGFDAMYPNSIRNRLRLQEQMAVLTKYIPKLVRPIFLAYAGLDPMKHSKNFKVLERTNELDLINTLTPTHIVHFGSYDPAVFRYSDPDWKNVQSPYVRAAAAAADGENSDEPPHQHDPALYALSTGRLAMEQILASIAAAPVNDRPHFIYASVATNRIPVSDNKRLHSGDQTLHAWSRRIDEVLADYYYQEYGVFSVGLRLPNSIYGPWGHPESDLYQLLDTTIREASSRNSTTTAAVQAALDSDLSNLDLLHVDDVVDAVIAAMQYRPIGSKPALFELSSGTSLSLRQVQKAVRQTLEGRSASIEIAPQATEDLDHLAAQEKLKRTLGWAPRIPVHEGLVRAIAWHADRLNLYGPPLLQYDDSPLPQMETGDAILRRHSLSPCAPDDLACHGGRPFLPCASECSARDQCIPTMFDDIVPLMQELTEECDIVLYTQDFDKHSTDLDLQSEFMEEGDPLVCNFAFVNSDSKLVDGVIEKVPDNELSKLGFRLTAEDENLPGGIEARKHEKLNGRLLYRGWILVWVTDVPSDLPSHTEYLLKLAPGRFFHQDVKAAVYIDQTFGVSPKADDIQFLVHEMHRKPWKPRVVKRKTRPKAKFMLPAEPQRAAVVLMSELKYQDSSDAERLSPDERINAYEATRFMRFSNGEEPLGKEPADIKLQREFYERLRTSINPDFARSPSEPLHKFQMYHWVRSRWVAHDTSHEESRQFRCEWYQEHVLWETDLDQLSFAYVMEKLELGRKLEHREPDEVVQKHLSEKTEMKKLLSDTFEWHALKTERNKVYSPYEEMQVLPYDMEYTDERELIPEGHPEGGDDSLLFVRVISDRIMAYARKAWNNGPAESQYEMHSEL